MPITADVNCILLNLLTNSRYVYIYIYIYIYLGIIKNLKFVYLYILCSLCVSLQYFS